ncbi:MAG: lipopolysaccharide biosynthesis protein [Deltaproteobacteria bacterium]|nr:lipopolysaccharide biosynthesis protein [Deltaproteobacteria bacterium]
MSVESQRVSRTVVTAKADIHRVLRLAAGAVAGNLLVVLATPLITRLYTPQDYARWILCISYVSILGTVASLRYENAVVLPKSHRDAVHAAALAIFCSFVVGCLSFLPLVLFSGKLSSVLSTDVTWLSLSWIPALVFLTGLSQTCLSWCTRSQWFGLSSIANACSALLLVLSQIVAAKLGYTTFWGLVVGSIIGQGGTTLILCCWIVFCERRSLKLISIKHLYVTAREYKNFPIYLTPYSIVGVIRERISLFFLNSWATQAVVGNFALAQRMTALPGGLISGSIRPVLFQKASTEESQSVLQFIEGARATLLQLSTPFVILFLFYAQDLFALIFGGQWRDGGIYAQILALPAFMFLFSDWTDRVLDVLGRQKLALKMEFVFSFLNVAVLFLSFWLTGNAFIAITLQALVVALFHGYWLYAVYRAARFPTIRLLRSALSFLCLCALYSGVLLIIRPLFPVWLACGIYSLLAAGWIAWLLFKKKIHLSGAKTFGFR